MRSALLFTLLLAPLAGAQIAPVTQQISSAEAHAIVISGDGGHVFYLHSFLESGAWMTALLHYDRTTAATTELVKSPLPPKDHETFLEHGGCSDDGRYVSYVTGLGYVGPGPGGPIYSNQTMLLDRLSGVSELISATPSGAPAGRSSLPVDVSPDGRYVLFTSFAKDLVVGDDHSSLDLFLRDRSLGVTTRISETVDGQPVSSNDLVSASVSADGALVVFSSDSNNLVAGGPSGRQVFLRSLPLGVTLLVSETAAGIGGDGHSSYEQISPDGRFVIFRSFAQNLAPGYPGGDGNLAADTFVKDLWTGALERVSVDSHELEGDDHSYARGISSNGRYVVFESYATNLVPGDTNQNADVFVRDRWMGITRRVSVASDGSDLHPAVGGSISNDGRFLAYQKATPADLGGFPCCSPAFLHDSMAGGPLLALENLAAGGSATLSMAGATPLGLVLVGWSFGPQSALGSPWGLLELSPPFWYLPLVVDAQGALVLPVGIPAGLAGVELWVQAIDAALGLPSNAFGGLVL